MWGDDEDSAGTCLWLDVMMPDTLTPNAMALQVVEFVRGEEYARFSRIIFDTAPTGHTLRLLAVPDFVNASLGKIIRLRKRLAGASSALRGLFGASEQQDEAVAKLERMQVRPGPPPCIKRPAFQRQTRSMHLGAGWLWVPGAGSSGAQALAEVDWPMIITTWLAR